jgi:hypothetical protein
MRKMGRVMLHLGLIVLLLGVFASENVVYETNNAYLEGNFSEIAPGITIRVDEVNMDWWNGPGDFRCTVEVQIIEGQSTIVGFGYAIIEAHPKWGSISHTVLVHSTAFRDVFIAVTAFEAVLGNQLLVTLHAKVLPFISFVWLGAFLMIAALLPMAGIEGAMLLEAIRRKEEHIYEISKDEEEEVLEPAEKELRTTKQLVLLGVRGVLMIIGAVIIYSWFAPWWNWITTTSIQIPFWYLSSDPMASLFTATWIVLVFLEMIALPIFWPKRYRNLLIAILALAILSFGIALMLPTQSPLIGSPPVSIPLGLTLTVGSLAILTLGWIRRKS